MEIKYTSDGKKVVVIGNLNSQEKIVQEIFIVNKQEVPSGENFVVKALHDAPAVSWKETNLKEIEANYESKKKQITDQLERISKEWRIKSAELKHKLEYAGAVLKNASPESFQTFVDVLTGNIKWVVVTGYMPELLEWAHFHTMYEDKFRLLSIFGRDNGSFTYSRGAYSDYSGGSTNFTPFSNYEDALAFFKEEILKRGVNDTTIELATKFNINFPDAEIAAFKEDRIKNFQGHITKYKEDIKKWELSIQGLNEKFPSL